jgi:hypothetical protein
MIVTDNGLTTEYRWRISIPSTNLVRMEDAMDWIDEMHIPCVVVPGAAYFRRHEDVVLFILRWT